MTAIASTRAATTVGLKRFTTFLRRLDPTTRDLFDRTLLSTSGAASFSSFRRRGTNPGDECYAERWRGSTNRRWAATGCRAGWATRRGPRSRSTAPNPKRPRTPGAPHPGEASPRIELRRQSRRSNRGYSDRLPIESCEGGLGPIQGSARSGPLRRGRLPRSRATTEPAWVTSSCRVQAVVGKQEPPTMSWTGVR
jgi:hypothetical protein